MAMHGAASSGIAILVTHIATLRFLISNVYVSQNHRTSRQSEWAQYHTNSATVLCTEARAAGSAPRRCRQR